MKLHEAAALVGAAVPEGAGDIEITGVASVAEAGPGEVTFFAHPRYLVALRSSRAAAAFVPEDFSENIAPVALRVAQPAAAFARILAAFAPPEPDSYPGIHPTAIIGEGVELGDGISVGPYAVIDARTRIGPRTRIGAHAYIGADVTIGADCRIFAHVSIRENCLIGDRVGLHNGVVVGSDGFGYEFVGDHHAKIPQTGIVVIEDDVEIGANTTIDRARFGRTVIGKGTKIDNLCQIAHNVTIGQHSILCSQVGLSGSTKVGNFVTLAGKVGVAGHLEIGDGAILTAMVGIAKSVKPKEILAGRPGKPIREYKENLALLTNIRKLYDRVKKLERKLAEPGGPAAG